jgi:hypothetical protein
MTLQVLPSESGLVVSQVVRVSTSEPNARVRFPLLLPETGPGPVVVQRTGQERTGLDIRAQAGTLARIESGDIWLHRKPGGTGKDLVAEVRYELPADVSRTNLVATTDVDLAGIQVLTRRSREYGLQIRLLAPYGFQEEVEEDGVWQILTALQAVPAGSRLGVSVGHIPAAFGPYRAVAIGFTGALAILLGLGLARGRRIGDGRGRSGRKGG